MKRKRTDRFLSKLILGIVLLAFSFGLCKSGAEAAFDSPLVDTFSTVDENGVPYQHWTILEDFPWEHQLPGAFYTAGKLTNPPPYWYSDGKRGVPQEIVDFHTVSTLRTPGEGEHYYKVERVGEIPVGQWKCAWEPGRCIHRCDYGGSWGGITFGNTGICINAYPSGWFAYCADCGEQISNCYVYATKESVSTIHTYDTSYTYYYVCPNPACRNLENTGLNSPHECKEISPNMYQIIYEKNPFPGGRVTGETNPSYHTYNNANTYEGIPVDPVTKLTRNGYQYLGYTFSHWTTNPDGTGRTFTDEEEIYNLTSENYKDFNGNDNAAGIIHLYAQWVETKSILQIDPVDGKYNGNNGITSIEKGYLDTYKADPSKITPVSHYKVSFVPNGGSAVPDMSVPEKFREWIKSTPFNGKMKDANTYQYTAPNGNVDRLTAKYDLCPIELPTPSWPGHSFGGWYEDPECTTKLVGFPGDIYTPTGNTTLYGKWVDLVLWSENNYIANNKKGAANLWWAENDSYIKSYNLFRSPDGVNFNKIFDTDVAAIAPVNKSYAFNASVPVQTYTVTDSGFYQFTAYGAQGADYNDGTSAYSGGLGGKVAATFYLTKGEVIRITIGGQNGTGGGGSKEVGGFSNGGGATTIEATKNGTTRTLIVAGGGGGASKYGEGQIGGPQDTSGLRGDGVSAGQSGLAGGGGGYRGGLAGNAVAHHCSEACLRHHVHTPECYKVTTEFHTCQICYECSNRYFISDNPGETGYSRLPASGSSKGCPHSACNRAGAGYWTVCKAYPNLGGAACPHSSGDRCMGPWHIDGEPRHVLYGYDEARYYCPFTGQKTETVELICGQDDTYVYCIEGKIDGVTMESTTLAYGGSSFVDSSRTSESYENGVRSGNGYVEMKSTALGMNDGLRKDGVAAPDLVAPDAILASTVSQLPDSAVRTTVSFDRPEDHGTTYWFRCESINVLTGGKICDSNIVKNELITGVKGYYYTYNTSATDTITATHYSYYLAKSADEIKESLALDLVYDVQYLHIAPVDVAGNVGPTLNIVIGKTEQAWPVVTTPVQISSVINGRDYKGVYKAPGGTIYVRADGNTPFQLYYDSYIDGNARLDYQIDTQNFNVNMSTPGTTQKFITGLPLNTSLADTNPIAAAKMSRSSEGTSILVDNSYMYAKRTNNCNRNTFAKGFVVPASLNGQVVCITPSASASTTDVEEGKIESKWASDVANAIKITPDAEAPVVTANQGLNSLTIINKDTIPDANVVLAATDALSGVKDFRAIIRNQDNGLTATYPMGADGKVSFTVDANIPVFEGDILIEVVTTDNVGNSRTVKYGVEEFAMTATIQNAGYNPTGRTTFMRGEVANLVVVTRGYADKVTIGVPAELQPGNESVPSEYIYSDPKNYRELESMLYTIPSTCPEGNYIFIVTAYKNGVVIEQKPVLVTIASGVFTGNIHIRIK